MKTKYLLPLLLASAGTVPAQTSSRQVQVPIPKTAAEVPGPVPGNTMTPAYVQLVAPDGSLTLYLGSKSPGQENEANWLPAPAGNFSLILRLYWPEASVLGTWGPPQIKTVN